MGNTASTVVTRAQTLATLPFVVVWLVVLLLYAQFNWELGPIDVSVEVPVTTAVGRGIGVLSIETVALYAILRPATFQRSWGRLLAALAVLLPWTALTARPLWAPGWWNGGHFAHAYWLLGVTVILFAT